MKVSIKSIHFTSFGVTLKRCVKKRQKSEVPIVVHCAAALIGGDLGDSLAIAILNLITVSGLRTCIRFSLNITRRKMSNGDGSGGEATTPHRNASLRLMRQCPKCWRRSLQRGIGAVLCGVTPVWCLDHSSCEIANSNVN